MARQGSSWQLPAEVHSGSPVHDAINGIQDYLNLNHCGEQDSHDRRSELSNACVRLLGITPHSGRHEVSCWTSKRQCDNLHAQVCELSPSSLKATSPPFDGSAYCTIEIPCPTGIRDDRHIFYPTRLTTGVCVLPRNVTVVDQCSARKDRNGV